MEPVMERLPDMVKFDNGVVVPIPTRSLTLSTCNVLLSTVKLPINVPAPDTLTRFKYTLALPSAVAFHGTHALPL